MTNMRQNQMKYGQRVQDTRMRRKNSKKMSELVQNRKKEWEDRIDQLRQERRYSSDFLWNSVYIPEHSGNDGSIIESCRRQSRFASRHSDFDQGLKYFDLMTSRLTSGQSDFNQGFKLLDLMMRPPNDFSDFLRRHESPNSGVSHPSFSMSVLDEIELSLITI